MKSIPTTTNALPFESGDWGRWTNLERCNWLRAFYEGLKSQEEHIAKGFKLDKKKMKRLADAMEVPNASGRSLLPRVTHAGLVTNGDEDYSVG